MQYRFAVNFGTLSNISNHVVSVRLWLLKHGYICQNPRVLLGLRTRGEFDRIWLRSSRKYRLKSLIFLIVEKDKYLKYSYFIKAFFKLKILKRVIYCMPKKSWPNLLSNAQCKMCQDFLDSKSFLVHVMGFTMCMLKEIKPV